MHRLIAREACRKGKGVMGNAIGTILPQAIGVAISPVPIIAVILMLFSKRARINGSAFLAGWVLALAVVGSVVLVLAGLGKVSAGGPPSTLAYVLKLLLGLVFLFLALRQWRSRPKAGAEPQMPKWMATIDAISAGKAFGLAVLLAGVNPKNLALTLAAALAIAQAGSGGAAPWITLAVFVILGSVTVAAPVLYNLFAGQKAEKVLNGWKVWLIANNATVMCILFLVLGAQLFGQGLGGLIG
jgi:threonine/homoserine/homoserine lactone efflux protein